MAVIPVGEKKSKVVEKDSSFIINQCPNKIMDDSCKYYGSSISGRQKGTTNLTGISYKAPIIVQEEGNIIFFPTSSPRLKKCCWVSLNNIDSYYYDYERKTCVIVFDNKEIKEMVDNDRHISRVLEMGRQANIALFSVGTVRDDALFFRLGYTDEQVNADIQQNAAGDIYSRFFDCDGKICNKELDDRTVGLRLADLQSKEHSILLSGGEAKLRAIRAALKGGYANVLITDQFTARSLLSEEE